MSLEAVYIENAPALRRRILRMTGDPQAAEDLSQETFARAWVSAPRDAEPGALRSWLFATAGNLAVDELRRRSRRGREPLGDLENVPEPLTDDGPGLARDALAELPPHERFVLLLRFHAGLTHGELAELLDVSEEAARKRVSRAREHFRAVYAAHSAAPAPLVLLVVRDDGHAPYRTWLEEAGARVRMVTGDVSHRDVLGAEAMVLSGANTDVHPGLYGQAPRVALHGEPDLARDRGDVAALRTALAGDVPIVGICRGHQLLNVLSGGTLFQDLKEDGGLPHVYERHDLRTADESSARALFGRDASVSSFHHQAVSRLGRELRVTAVSPDGVVETIERTDRRFAIGVQWHPQAEPDARASKLLAEALLEKAVARRAA